LTSTLQNYKNSKLNTKNYIKQFKNYKTTFKNSRNCREVLLEPEEQWRRVFPRAPPVAARGSNGRKFSASSPFPFLHRRWQPLSPEKGTKRNNQLF
jgi:hypothetical protein